MIVFDLEMSGLDPNKHGIWQIGAIDLDNPKNTFLEEARIDDDDESDPEALVITEKTEKELRDTGKQSQKEMLKKFFSWAGKAAIKNCICQNPQFDTAFIRAKAVKYHLKVPFHYRAFDLHSIASMKYFEKNGKFLVDKDHSAMNLTNTLDFCGIKDERKITQGGVTVKEGKPHNALEDAKLTAECFSRIVYGKKLLKDYASNALPDYLK